MDEKIYIAGHTGMVGSAVHRALLANGSRPRIITCDHANVDLRDAKATKNFFQKHAITQVYVCAAQVGGILANNSRPYDFIFNNISIQLSIMQAALENGVKKLLFLGSSCIYPKECPQPMKEKHLLSGYLEATNEPYAIAKIAGIKLCESINRQFHNDGFDFRALMPTNLYGPGDNYHPTDSHVIAALIRKFIFAKRNSLPVVSVWGSGSQLREFMHVDDVAAAALHVMDMEFEKFKTYAPGNQCFLNAGSGQEIEIGALAHMIADISGFRGKIEFDKSKMEGVKKKLLDSSALKSSGWSSSITLADGLRKACSDYEKSFSN